MISIRERRDYAMSHHNCALMLFRLALDPLRSVYFPDVLGERKYAQRLVKNITNVNVLDNIRD